MFFNDNRAYRDQFFRDRDVKQILQYKTARFNFPTNEQISTMESFPYRWGATDKLYNVAYDYYGYASLWWIIAWFNKKPTAAHFKIGDIVYIPLPLESVLEFFEGV
jgi:hypothetical protein